jgi:hypothetical protein
MSNRYSYCHSARYPADRDTIEEQVIQQIQLVIVQDIQQIYSARYPADTDTAIVQDIQQIQLLS